MKHTRVFNHKLLVNYLLFYEYKLKLYLKLIYFVL